MSDSDITPALALAIADLTDHDQLLLDEIQGHFLVAGGRSQQLTPAAIARKTTLSREAASDLFRQLERVDAVDRDSFASPVVESQYHVDSTLIPAVFDAARESISVVEAYRAREPQTEVIPLVTFPEDPSFEATTPAAFGMDGLMSTLASEIKQSSDEIRLLAPFFERGGFDRLANVLFDALDRGVELTVVTRYLQDKSSYNYEVIQNFVAQARARGVGGLVNTVDYTMWEDDVPASGRRQDGDNPAFTLHAKVMMFDNRAVYVGSANVTDYGFGRYLELGVLLRGTQVSSFVDLSEYLLESDAATPVDL